METNSKRIKQEEEEAEEGSSRHPWLSVSPGQETFRDCPVKKEGSAGQLLPETRPVWPQLKKVSYERKSIHLQMSIKNYD